MMVNTGGNWEEFEYYDNEEIKDYEPEDEDEEDL